MTQLYSMASSLLRCTLNSILLWGNRYSSVERTTESLLQSIQNSMMKIEERENGKIFQFSKLNVFAFKIPPIQIENFFSSYESQNTMIFPKQSNGITFLSKNIIIYIWAKQKFWSNFASNFRPKHQLPSRLEGKNKGLLTPDRSLFPTIYHA